MTENSGVIVSFRIFQQGYDAVTVHNLAWGGNALHGEMSETIRNIGSKFGLSSPPKI